ncbi:MAG: MBL fold metallo-hydrolase [Acidimicrobiia bacterium]|nr:MBL fold metallo-hydrolase [Acidimicrobiia bacterium]
MPAGVRVTFHGVRGSTPCEGPQYARYGGNTSCVSLEVDGAPPILFDLGTGLRPYGIGAGERAWRGSALLTHLHWDHVQGLPFFAPLHDAGTVLEVFGPRQVDGTLAEAFAGLMRPPYFPVRPMDLGGAVSFHDMGEDEFAIGSANVKARWVRHPGPTLGFRVEWNGVSIAYVPDHGPGCAPGDAEDFVPPEMLDLCDGVDLLIHDAQHTRSEYDRRQHWGHCTVDYAVHVARAAGARCLALFHHDPARGDDDIDRILTATADRSAGVGGPEVVAAAEGLVLDLAPPAARSRVCEVDLRTAPDGSMSAYAPGSDVLVPVESMVSVSRAAPPPARL